MKNDEIDQILRQIAVPEPSEEARKAAVSLALAEFDMKNKKTTQGSSIPSRLMDMLNQLDRRINMRKAYYYGASVAAIVLTLGIVSYDELGGEKLNDQFATHKSFAPPQQRTSSPIAIAPPEPLPAIAPPPQETHIRDKDALLAKKPAPGLVKEESKASGQAVNEAMPAPPPAVPMPASSATPMRSFAAKKTDSRVQGFIGNGGAQSDLARAPGMPGENFYQPQNESNDKFEKFKINPVKVTAEEAVSTFSIDVDTSSYSFIRRQLSMGALPQKDAVRVEEMVNYFDYNYPLPANKAEPFKPSVTVLPSPWHKGNKLVHIGIKGYDIAPAEKPRSNLVFLIDTSGSMAPADRLPLVLNSLSMLVNELNPDDTISIVTYAGYAGTALEPTKVRDKAKILSVLQNLQSGGSTAGAEGIRQAYNLAKQNFDKGGVNRVILATDGDFNVGITDPNELQNFIEKKRDSGVFLSVLGVGQGNYNDAMMQKLAQNGNGNAAYIDNINEARKVLVQEASSTLFPIAKDVKIQVEFNKDKVSEYRLIGYESRLLNREDFNNDKVDAGEIGSGHAVTAIYEITPKGEKGLVDESRYGEPKAKEERTAISFNEYGFVKIRYKLPKESESKLLTTPITAANEVATIDKASNDVRFAVSVAGFGELLHGDSYVGDFKYDDVENLATGAKGEDKFGYRAEFINLVKTAKAVPQQNQEPPRPDVDY